MKAKAPSQPVADGRVAGAGVQQESERTGAVDPGGHHNRAVLIGVETNDVGVARRHGRRSCGKGIKDAQEEYRT
jgi:hypothetical protein